jgi:chromodomain-helicase-DNA-binding protein 1
MRDRAYTVSNFWPRSNMPVQDVRGMYDKMLSQELKDRQGANGEANGS